MTDLRRVFDDLVRFETILWGAIDARLQEECGVGKAAGESNFWLGINTLG